MKRSVKLLSVFLSLVLLLTLLIPAASAAQHPAPIVVKAPLTDAIEVPEDISPEVNWEGVKEAIVAGMQAYDEHISLASFGIECTDANVEYISNILYNTPSLLFNSAGYSIQPKIDHTIDYLTNNYMYSQTEYDAMLAECLDAVIQLLYGIKGNTALTDAEKCMLAHDRLAAWCGYDSDNLAAGTVPHISHSAYAALVLRDSVCQGYAYAYDWLMDELGIQDVYVSSDAGNHGWNMVTLAGEEYFVDVTGDDPSRDLPGRVNHKYLLSSLNDTFTNTSLHRIIDYTQAPDSDLYDNMYWKDVRTQIQYVNGAFYYIEPDYDKDDYMTKTHLNLVKRLSDGTETTVANDEAMWTLEGGSYYRSENAKLTSIGDEIIYSLPDKVCAYNTLTGETGTIYTPDLSDHGVNWHIYGLTQINGDLIIVLCDTPNINENTTAVTLTVPYCEEHENREVLSVISEPTATADGSAKYICADCRAVFTDVLPRCEHEYGAWTTVTAGTCAAKGLEKRVCTKCSAVETRETDKNASNHTGGTETRNAAVATCTAAGYTGDTYCLGCGVKLADGETITMLSHSFGAWTVATAATCAAKGLEKRVCANCPETETRETEKNTANHVGGTETRNAAGATCTAAGYTGDTYCLGCGVKLADGETITKLSHSFGAWTVEIAATCAAKGLEKRVCANCPETETRETEKNTANHVGGTETRNAAGATCTAAGYTGDTYCLGCGVKLADGETITKLAHSFGAWTVETAATCAAKGLEKRVCANCPETETRETEKNAANHAGGTENREAITATCVTAGRSAGVCCLGCGSYISGGEDLGTDKNVHGESVVTKTALAPTCTKAGHTEEISCKDCKTVLTASAPLAALDHRYVPSQTVALTCTEDGYTLYVCVNCSDFYKSDVVAAPGHSDADKDGICDVCHKDMTEPQNACGHLCHKNGILGFLWKILNLFNKLFRINQYCECGAAHW